MVWQVADSVESDSESSSESDSDEEVDGVELNSGISLDKDRQEKIEELAALSEQTLCMPSTPPTPLRSHWQSLSAAACL